MSESNGTKLALACFFWLGGCVDPVENCDPVPCAKYRYELVLIDSLGHKVDTLGTTGLRMIFDPLIPIDRRMAGENRDCAECTGFIRLDSTVLMADRPIFSPEGDTVPAGSNLLSPPWNGMLGEGDLHFRFHNGVRFESGRYAFSMKALWKFKNTRAILSDTSHLQVP